MSKSCWFLRGSMCGSIARDMTVFTSVNDTEITRLLAGGGVGILRTDTLYGLVARADDEAAVQRIYELKGRDDDKSPIVLIDGIDQLYDQPDEKLGELLDSAWPGPVSIILPSKYAPTWIRRGNDSVAYRMPDNPAIRQLVRATGPLIAPSANPQGDVPAMNIDEAQRYFGEEVDFYVDGGVVIDQTPSQLILVGQDGNTTRLR